MKVLVQVWCENDPTLNVRIDRHTGQPQAEPGDRLQRVSPLGRAGIHAAMRLSPRTITAFAIGPGHTDALRHALAAGAADAVELAPANLSVATLADWVSRQQADLVIADRIAGLIAARLGWSHVAGLDELHVESGRLHAVRFLPRGDREKVNARLPAAVRLQTESVRVPYVSRARLQAADTHPIVRTELPGATQVADPGPLQPARARVRLGKAPQPTATSGSSRLQALLGGPAANVKKTDLAIRTCEDLAEEFVRYLLQHELL